MEGLKLFQEMFRSLKADEFDTGKEGKRGIKDNFSIFGLRSLKEEQGWREDRVLFWPC